MGTKAQVKANRKNSKKSTGPQSAKGKAKVAKNAIKHGLFASEAVIKGENPEDFEHFREEILAELAPAGHMESILAERVVSLSWRLQRQNQSIDQFIERHITNPLPRRTRVLTCHAQGIPLGDPRCTSGHLQLGRMATRDWSNCRVLDRLLMYERRMESSLFRTMRELERLRLLRELKQAEAANEQPATQSSPSLRDEATTQTPQQNVDLKKQFMPKGSQSPAFGGKSEACAQPSLRQGSGQAPSLRDEATTRPDPYSSVPLCLSACVPASEFEKTKPIAGQMNVSGSEKRDYERKTRPGLRENKAEYRPLAGNPKRAASHPFDKAQGRPHP